MSQYPAGTCQIELINAGGAYPRSCPTCGLGPCKKGLPHPFAKPERKDNAMSCVLSSDRIAELEVMAEGSRQERREALERAANEGAEKVRATCITLLEAMIREIPPGSNKTAPLRDAIERIEKGYP